MGSSSLELSLSLKPSYVPKTIANLLKDLSKIDSVSDKLSVLNDYLLKCQEELSRVEAFKRELPQCMLLLMDAIETLKDEIMNVGNSKEPESGKPLTEFLSMKRKHYEYEQRIISDQDPARKEKDLITNMNSSAEDRHQLWNPIPDKKQKTILHPTQALSLAPIQPCKNKNTEVPLMAAATAAANGTSSSFFLESGAEKLKGKEAAKLPVPGAIGPVGLNLRTDPVTLNYHPQPLTEKIWKNNRRAWSPQLHARFVQALNILGGVQVATPKQIRDVMQVDGLTNDQVKSHLQKYRLHVRIPEVHHDLAFFGRENINDPWTYFEHRL